MKSVSKSMPSARKRLLTAVTLLAVLAISTPGQEAGSTVASTQLTAAQREAREELNRAAAAYRKGDFAEAQRHSEEALTLDPTNRLAPNFLARSIHIQFQLAGETPENLEKGREAIRAYQRILAADPTNEEAYKAVAAIYGALREEQLLRDWILQRAANPVFAAEKRAEAYAVLAGKDWDCSFKITMLPENKLLVKKDAKFVVVFQKPNDESDFQKARQCVTSGLEMAEMAIALDPTSEPAWSYKTNLLVENSRLSQMEHDAIAEAAFSKLADEARLQAQTLAEKRTRKESEVERAEPPISPHPQ
jgi:tetratricopeptide (TPR) repeat protein